MQNEDIKHKKQGWIIYCAGKITPLYYEDIQRL